MFTTACCLLVGLGSGLGLGLDLVSSCACKPICITLDYQTGQSMLRPVCARG